MTTTARRMAGTSQCSRWADGTECGTQAEGWLVAPDGKPVMAVCEPCARVVLEEYARHEEAVGGVWSWDPD